MDIIHTQALRHILSGGILPFDEPTATLSGALFFQTGSNRRTRMDTMIAASAILAGAELATVNPVDFEPFVPLGLKLLSMCRQNRLFNYGRKRYLPLFGNPLEFSPRVRLHKDLHPHAFSYFGFHKSSDLCASILHLSPERLLLAA